MPPVEPLQTSGEKRTTELQVEVREATILREEAQNVRSCRLLGPIDFTCWQELEVWLEKKRLKEEDWREIYEMEATLTKLQSDSQRLKSELRLVCQV